MKRSLGFMAITLALTGCGQSTAPDTDNKKADTVFAVSEVKTIALPRDLFKQVDAENIMGEPAHLQDSSNSIKGDTGTYQCSYIANAKSANGKTGVIYFMFEQYSQVSPAHDVYAGIKKANEANGIQTLDSLGDEAYFHTDNTGFYFIMARKGTKMIRMKVNKITPTTSKDQFNLVAKNIIAQL